jgi:hypothetical protein
MMRLLLFFLFFGFILLVSSGLTSCKDTQTNPSLEPFPDSNVSFTKNIEPLFQQKCAPSPCHGGSAPAAGFNLESPYAYTNLLTPAGLVIPGDANHSTLVQRLVGSFDPMPPPKSPQLTQNQITGIKKWIDEGAKYN